MEIDHCSLYLGVAKKLLDGMDILAGIKQMGGPDSYRENVLGYVRRMRAVRVLPAS